MTSSTISQILNKIKSRYSIIESPKTVLGWGGNQWHFYEPREDNTDKEDELIRSLDDLDTVKVLKKFEKDGELPADEDEDEDEEVSKKNKAKTTKNSPEVEKTHQNSVLKSRKLQDKLTALEKVQAPEFLKKLILSKAHESVKIQAALKLEREEDAKELFLARKDDISGFPSKELSKLLKDEKFIVDHFDKILTEDAIKKVKDENKLVDLLLKHEKDIEDDWYYRRSNAIRFGLENIKDQKLLTKLGMRIKEGEFEDLAFGIAIKSNDPKVLKHLLSIDSYRALDPAKAIALYKLRDTEEGEKAATKILKGERYFDNNVSRIAISITKDQSLLKKYATQAPGLVIPRLKDQDEIKEIAKKEPELWAYIEDDEWKKAQRKKLARAGDEYLMTHTLDHIKDKTYVMEEALKGGKLNKEWLKKLSSDQTFVKNYFEKTQDFEALSFIDDVDYLESLLKKEKKSDPREKIIKGINDPDILLKLLKKERGKGNRHILIWKLRNHPEKIADYLVNDFDDADTHRYGAGKLDKNTAIKILDKKITGPQENHIDDEILVEHIGDDQKTLLRLFKAAPKGDRLRDILLTHINQEDFIFKHTKPEDVDSTMLDNIKKDENLLKIALVNKQNGLEAFRKIDNLSKDQYEKLLLESVVPAVRKAALPYVDNKEVLKQVLLHDENNGADALPNFKDDQKVLEEAFLEAADEKVVSNLATRIKNQKILEEYVLKADNWKTEQIAEKIIPKIKDPKFVQKLFEKSKRDKLRKKAFETLKEDPSNRDFLAKTYLKDEELLNDRFYFEKVKELLTQDELKHVVTHTEDVAIFINSFSLLSEDTDNAEFLVNLYLGKDYSKFHHGAERAIGEITSIVAPFLSAEMRLKQMENASIVNNLKIEDFKPTKEEAKKALSGTNPNKLTESQLISLLKIVPEYAPEVWYNTQNNRKGSVLPFLKADFVTEENVLGIAQAIKSSHHRNSIPQELIDKTYTLGDERIKTSLKGDASEGVLTEEHKKEQQNERFKYRVAQHTTNIPMPLKDQKVQHHAKDELFRLLVTLAR